MPPGNFLNLLALAAKEKCKLELIKANLSNGLSLVHAFILHGVLDIILSKTKVIEVHTGPDEGNSLSSGDAIIQNCHQRYIVLLYFIMFTHCICIHLFIIFFIFISIVFTHLINI